MLSDNELKFSYRCLQFFNKIQWNVFWQCIFNFFEGFIVNGVVNVIIPALEKRYNLSSQRSAIIASGNDFVAFIFFVFVGYIGERVHKPKLMAAGVLVMSLGSFIFLLPHFIGEKYHYTLSGRYIKIFFFALKTCILIFTIQVQIIFLNLACCISNWII